MLVQGKENSEAASPYVEYLVVNLFVRFVAAELS
jgi:hypothetical protein